MYLTDFQSKVRCSHLRIELRPLEMLDCDLHYIRKIVHTGVGLCLCVLKYTLGYYCFSSC